VSEQEQPADDDLEPGELEADRADAEDEDDPAEPDVYEGEDEGDSGTYEEPVPQ